MSGDDYHRRTAITRLAVSSTDESLLRDTIEEWKQGCQIAVDKAWMWCHSKSDVQQLAYDGVRENTNLGSQHAILACHQAAENIKSCISRRQDGKKASKPTYTSPTITYDSRTMTVFPEKEQVSLTTHGDHSRVRADLVLPDDKDGYQHQYLDSDEWEPTESTLHYRNGDWYLHLGFRKPKQDAEEATENGTVLGVDLGVNEIAVTSTARFFSAGELNHKRREFERVRGDLQKCGTRNAHRTMEAVSGREDRYVKHVLHSVANGIVEEALEHDCDGIVFEELDGIRERLPEAAWHSEWAFDRLYEYVEYKAEAEGLFVETTNPKNTSKRCAECGFIHDANRPSRDTFECQQCGNRNHADYNAAKNVADVSLRREQQSSRGRGVSQYALKSGTVTPNRGYTPYSTESEAESTDKSHPQRASPSGRAK
ncbi:RNA-guided endonuclease InsQ/TnpB family protein [Natronococcus occultus]|uniref:Transposase, IS605 OrfB family, central region n=1 Tax=Natronococcus occultus SP4 TaxID=694430 RepID=L0K1F1_9EURY|nr:RNA-guided endonuclease TnpB family protein [Natronococcus occultus]AGB38365.1 transposase, IS605 OrfB family, central region [Natronococcus occultus SP4]